jgi:hypothetical protein
MKKRIEKKRRRLNQRRMLSLPPDVLGILALVRRDQPMSVYVAEAIRQRFQRELGQDRGGD